MRPGKGLAIGRTTLLLLFGVLLLAGLGLTYGLSPLIRASLINGLPKATRGIYHFESLNVRVRPFYSSIELRDVVIKTDSLALARLGAGDSAPATRWQADAPSITIRLQQPWRIWMGQPVRIAEIRAEKPVIRLAYERAEGKSRPFTGQFRQILQQLVDTRGGLRIDRFVVDGGELQFNNNRKFSRDAFIARDLHAEVLGFDLDSQSIKRADRPFRIREFHASVGVEDYSFVLPDSTYEVKAARIGFSSGDGVLFADKVHVRPNYRMIQKQTIGQRPSVVEVTINQVGLGGMDIKKWLETGHLFLASIRFDQPHVVWVQGKGAPTANFNAKDLYKQIKPVAQSIEIAGISVEKGQFTRLQTVGNSPADIQVDGIGAYFQGMRIDSQRLARGEGWSGSFEVKTGPFSFQNEDMHASGSAAYLSTPEKRFTLTRLQARSRTKKGGHHPDFQLKAASAGAEGVLFEELLRGRFRKLDKLWVRGAEGVLVAAPADPAKPAGLVIPGMDSAFALGALEIDGENLRYSNHNGQTYVQTHRLRLMARALQLGPGKQPQIKSFSLDAEIDSSGFVSPDGRMRLATRDIAWASRDSSLTIAGISFSQKNTRYPDSVPLHITAPGLYLRGLDAYSLAFGRKIVADSLSLTQARIIPANTGDTSFVLSDAVRTPDLDKIMGAWADTLRIRTISAQGMRLGASDSLPPANVRLEQIAWTRDTRPNPQSFWYARNALFMLGKGRFGATSIDSLVFSTLAEDLRVFGLRHADENVAFHLPEVHIGSWKWPLYLSQKKLEARLVRLYQPSVERWAIPNPAEGNTDKQTTWAAIRRIAQSFRLETFNIPSGAANVTPPGMPELRTRNIKATVSAFALDSASWVNEKSGIRMGGLVLGLEMDRYRWFLPDSNYQISIGKIGFNSENSEVEAVGLELSPRPGADFEGLNAQWTIKTPELRIQGLNIEDLLNRKGIRMKSLGIDRPDIRWTVLQEDGQPLEEALTAAFQPVLNRWGAISVDAVRITGASLVREFGFETEKKPATFSGLSLRLVGFAPDRQEAFRPGRLLYSREMEILISKYVLDIQKGDYTGTVSNLAYSSATATVTADSFVVRPVMRLFDYYLKKKYVVDDLVAQLKDITLSDVEGLALLTRGAIRGHKLTIGDLRLTIMRDRRFDQKPDRSPPMPQDLLRRAIMPIAIDSVVFPRARIAYSEMVPYWSSAGEFILDSMRLTIANVTNVAPENPMAHLRASGLLMGKTPLVLDGQFALGDTLNTYLLNGKVGSMPLVYLNPILGTAARIQMRQGVCQGIDFTYNGNSRTVTGKMRFYYADMKLDIYDNRGGKQEIESSRKFLSALANSLVVRQNNPNNKWLRVGRIRYTTEPFRFITGHWLKAFAQGALSSMGIGSKGERDEILNPKDKEAKEKK